MYLTAGQFKGIKIEVPPLVKPTLSKVRESIFNMLLSFDLDDNSFLDMFSGSGIMGLEALSRGYEVKGIEINKKNIEAIKKNYEKIKIKPDIIYSDCLKFKSDKKFSIIYIDPPWQMDYKPVILKAKELLNKNGVVFIEYDKQKKMNMPEIIEECGFKIIKSKKYGRCLIEVLHIVTK